VIRAGGDKFRFVSRGENVIKGKGVMQTYFLKTNTYFLKTNSSIDIGSGSVPSNDEVKQFSPASSQTCKETKSKMGQLPIKSGNYITNRKPQTKNVSRTCQLI